MIDDRYREFLTGNLRTQDIEHSGRDFYTHLRGTYDLLAAWGNPKFVCLAGLFHSIYGTFVFRRKTLAFDQRNTVRELIGHQAEFLAYVFCVTERGGFPALAAGSGRVVVEDYRTKEKIALSRTELTHLLEIEAANLIEQGGDVQALLRRLLTTPISRAAKTAVAAALGGPAGGQTPKDDRHSASRSSNGWANASATVASPR